MATDQIESFTEKFAEWKERSLPRLMRNVETDAISWMIYADSNKQGGDNKI